ncbi:MAG: hypothetical protein EZS28_055548, partial [Streblomastix strix]
VDQVYVLGLE